MGPCCSDVACRTSRKDRLNITCIQIYCLTILAREVFAIGGDLVWISMGSLVNRAMQMGLHRDPKHLPPMPVLQVELRRRLWVTILEMLVQHRWIQYYYLDYHSAISTPSHLQTLTMKRLTSRQKLCIRIREVFTLQHRYSLPCLMYCRYVFALCSY
jgi:hypothetical protein